VASEEDKRQKSQDKSKEHIIEKAPNSPPSGGLGGKNQGKRYKSQDKSEVISCLSPPFGGLGGKNQEKKQK